MPTLTIARCEKQLATGFMGAPLLLRESRILVQMAAASCFAGNARAQKVRGSD
jgi:hypothetical protein